MKNTFIINGQVYKFRSQLTICSLLQYLGFNTNLIVIDYNGTILQKNFWEQTKLTSNDKIEILTVAGGG